MQGRLFVDPLSFKKLPQLGCHCLTLLSLHFHSNRNIGEIKYCIFKVSDYVLSIQLVQGLPKKNLQSIILHKNPMQIKITFKR